ncbi:MAG: prepilin-type N-terminal cleavage/methylation domain-containing protein [Puniceicoccales bacterium]|jgi:prepilin-type processing-associated H-X9-DG protein|nr:prepilin-type N-terminal cleavage/methylation domain-containing protein [Puniceicoccales bacterium]
MARQWTSKSVKSRKSFTLVEIIFTISIIGILLTILLPAVHSIKLAAKKTKDISNLKKIAEAWYECTINRGWMIDGIDDHGILKISVFMEQLAGLNKNSISDMVLNDSSVYISPGDKYASKLNDETLTYFDSDSEKILYSGKLTPEAQGTLADTNNFLGSAQQISYCFVCGLSADAPLSTTPLGFTRGLRTDGKWDEKVGLYGSKGGYVVYCDGHVTWFDGDKPARFLKWSNEEYTSDIRYAVPNLTDKLTFITCSNQGIDTNYESDGSLVILYHKGEG